MNEHTLILFYREVQTNSCTYKIPGLMLPANPGQQMDSPSALKELSSPNLAGTILHHPVQLLKILNTAQC